MLFKRRKGVLVSGVVVIVHVVVNYARNFDASRGKNLGVACRPVKPKGSCAAFRSGSKLAVGKHRFAVGNRKIVGRQNVVNLFKKIGRLVIFGVPVKGTVVVVAVKGGNKTVAQKGELHCLRNGSLA